MRCQRNPSRGLVIAAGTVTTVTSSDITWVPAGWRVKGEETLLEPDTTARFQITVSGSAQIEVTDPFHLNETRSYDEYLMMLEGIGDVKGNSEGWLTMTAGCGPSGPGPCRFVPYLAFEAFGLPTPPGGGRYYFYPVGEVIVEQ